MKRWDTWLSENDHRLRAAARAYARSDWAELYQIILISSWHAYTKYGNDFFRMAGKIILNSCRDYRRSLRTRNRFQSIEDDIDLVVSDFEDDLLVGIDKDELLDRLFEVAFDTDNLVAARFMRGVVNPERRQLLMEIRIGGFRWSILTSIVGKSNRERRAAFKRLRKDYEQRFGRNVSLDEGTEGFKP